MKKKGGIQPTTVGFMTVTGGLDAGLFGGYLVLNLLGRPVEFHCTAPVCPNRAQEILYGPTLEPYVAGELIGQALLAQAKATPQIVFTDVGAMLAVRPIVAQPMALVQADREPDRMDSACPTSVDRKDARFTGPETGTSPPTVAERAAVTQSTHMEPHHLDVGHPLPRPAGLGLRSVMAGEASLAIVDEYSDDEACLRACWPELSGAIDLIEPFSRIREAIVEAGGGSRP